MVAVHYAAVCVIQIVFARPVEPKPIENSTDTLWGEKKKLFNAIYFLLKIK